MENKNSFTFYSIAANIATVISAILAATAIYLSINTKQVVACNDAVSSARVGFADHKNLRDRENALPSLVADIQTLCDKKAIGRISMQLAYYVDVRCHEKGSPGNVCGALKVYRQELPN